MRLARYRDTKVFQKIMEAPISGSITHDQALKKKLQELVPLLDRLGRALIDSAPHLSAYAASLPDVADIRDLNVPLLVKAISVYFDLDEEDVRQVKVQMFVRQVASSR
jgi:hypothetical protein